MKVELVGGMKAEERLAWAKTELEAIQTDGDALWQNRVELEEVRRCVWDKQNADGRKHKDEDTGEEAFPFEGAADNRIRLVDQIINEKAMLCVTAALRAPVVVRGMRSGNDGFGKRMETALKWIMRNQWGSEMLEWLMLLAQYREGDQPAAALAGVYWDRREALRLKRITIQELQALYLQMLQARIEPDVWPEVEREAMAYAEALPEELVAAANDGGEERQAEVVEMLGHMFPEVSEKRRKRAVRELVRDLRKGVDDARCEFPQPYTVMNGPRVTPLRVGEDVLVPLNMERFQDARIYFTLEWLPEYEIRNRQRSRDYSEAFVEALLAQAEGATGRPTYTCEGKGMMRKYTRTADGEIRQATAEDYRGLFQVVTAYFRGTDEDGVGGVFSLAFNPELDMPATEMELLDLPHNDYPGVWFQREFLSSRGLDSRSWAELLGAAQSSIKDLSDSFNNHASLTAVPTLIAKGRRSTARMKIGQLEVINLKPQGDVKAMDMGRFPSAAVQQGELTRRDADALAGRANAGVDQRLTDLHTEWTVMSFLSGVRDVLTMVLKLWQAFSTPEERELITGAKGEQLFMRPEDVEGDFRLDLRFDPRSTDVEYLAEKAKILKDVFMPLDVDATIKWAVITQWLFMAFDPDLAELALDSVEGAQAREIEDEMLVWCKALAGVETPPKEQGQNFGARLQWLQQRMQEVAQQPEFFGAVSPAAEEIVTRRVQHLEFMVQQQQNAQTGRVGVEQG
jgi:hypothetical protein